MQININRVRTLYRAWYQPEYKMQEEEWIYIGALILACNFGFGLGLVIGLVIC